MIMDPNDPLGYRKRLASTLVRGGNGNPLKNTSDMPAAPQPQFTLPNNIAPSVLAQLGIVGSNSGNSPEASQSAGIPAGEPTGVMAEAPRVLRQGAYPDGTVPAPAPQSQDLLRSFSGPTINPVAPSMPLLPPWLGAGKVF